MYHYVYRITNIQLRKHYYGVRSSELPPQDDLGKVYFSSSTDKDFLQEQKDNPNLFKYIIVKVFKTRKEANEFEYYLHKRFNVGINENFYNRAMATSSGFGNYGIPNTPESNEKRSNSLKGKKRQISKEHGRALSASLKNLSKSEEHKSSISKSLTGKTKSNSHKQNLRVPKRKQECPHCGQNATKRWHFDNCKQNPDYIKPPKRNIKISEEGKKKIKDGVNNRRPYNNHMNPKSRPILIDNICFLSIKDAMEFLGLSRYKVTQDAVYLDK